LSKELIKLKLDLFCKGLKITDDFIGGKGRKSGAGPAGGRFLKLKDDIVVNVPIWPDFARESPYFLKKSTQNFELWKSQNKLIDVELIPSKYKFYEKKTSTNILMKKIALIHGERCLATTIIQTCHYWNIGKPCVFCGIEGSLKINATKAKKSPEELYEVVMAAKDEGVCEHITLTTGTTGTKDKGAAHMEKVVKKLYPLDIPIHVQIEPPREKIWFKKLYEAGSKTIGVHVETLDSDSFKKNCPGKSEDLSINNYKESWSYCVELFGKNQVSTYYLIGLEEINQQFFENIEEIAKLGVIPFLVPIRPISGSKLNIFKKFTYLELLNIYKKSSQILHKHNLNPFENKAGCVRCNACSATKESYKYLK